MRPLLLLGLFLLLTSSCAAETPPTPPQAVSVYSTAAATPWLPRLYACAGASLLLARVDDPSAAEMILRLGEPRLPAPFAYRIDEDELLIAAHPHTTLPPMTLQQVQALFAGLGDPSLQVWVYASGEDVAEAFDQFVMQGRSVSSSARVAVHPQQMSDVLTAETNAVGVLPRRWKAAEVRDLYSAAKIPVLVITQSEPQGEVKQLIGCLQNP
jgi:hypothetical protein